VPARARARAKATVSSSLADTGRPQWIAQLSTPANRACSIVQTAAAPAPPDARKRFAYRLDRITLLTAVRKVK
jgi:hypothetical protein